MKIILPHWLELVLGVRLLDDAIVAECVERAKKRCANVDCTLHSRESAEDAMVLAAREAVAAVFQDHFPAARRANLVRHGWPKARVMLLGTRATIQIWIGLDYEEVDGIEPFDITVVRPAKAMGLVEKVKLKLSGARVLVEEAPVDLVAARPLPPSSPPEPFPQPQPAPQPAAARNDGTISFMERTSRMKDRIVASQRNR